MSYLGNNPKLKSVVFEGYADLATADASARRKGRLVYVRDVDNFYKDDGVGLIRLGGGLKVSAAQTIAAVGGHITLTKDNSELVKVQGDGGAVTADATPFDGDFQDGDLVQVMGLSNTNTVTIAHNDAASGVILNGDATLGRFDILSLYYDSTENRFIEIGRNF